MTEAMAPVRVIPEAKHSQRTGKSKLSWYWTWYRFAQWTEVWTHKRPIRNPLILASAALVLLIFLSGERYEVQPLVVYLYKRLFWVFFGLIVLWFVKLKWSRLRTALKAKSIRSMVWQGSQAVAVVALFYFVGRDAHDTVAYLWQYNDLPVERISKPLFTDRERFHPFGSIETLVQERMQGPLAPSTPRFVRDQDGTYKCTMVVEPTYLPSQWWGVVDQVWSLPCTTPALSFAPENIQKVHFDASPNLAVSHNTRRCVIRSFSPYRFLTYEPGETVFLKDDSGAWVQVTSLIHWRGFLFPWPVFGGVQVIRQQSGGPMRWIERSQFGCGEFIAPEDIGKYPYLRGQNLVPEVVTRHMAESFRFQNGIFAPLGWYHAGDVRVPDLPSVTDSQPFIGYFSEAHKPGKIYQYYALEPYDDATQGLSSSVFIPSDGIGNVLLYDHAKHRESIIGVSAVLPKVRASKTETYWSMFHIAEIRPVIREKGSSYDLWWMTTLVTNKDEEKKKKSVAAQVPDVILINAFTNESIKLDMRRPDPLFAIVGK